MAEGATTRSITAPYGTSSSSVRTRRQMAWRICREHCPKLGRRICVITSTSYELVSRSAATAVGLSRRKCRGASRTRDHRETSIPKLMPRWKPVLVRIFVGKLGINRAAGRAGKPRSKFAVAERVAGRVRRAERCLKCGSGSTSRDRGEPVAVQDITTPSSFESRRLAPASVRQNGVRWRTARYPYLLPSDHDTPKPAGSRRTRRTP